MVDEKQIDVAIQRSGIASVLSMPNRAGAEQLHDYLKGQGCTVGEVFEVPGEFSFFAYSIKHPVRETLASHGGYRLVERRSDLE